MNKPSPFWPGVAVGWIAGIVVAWGIALATLSPAPRVAGLPHVEHLAPPTLTYGAELEAARSPTWQTFEKHFLAAHPTCAACGGPSEVGHHIQPFHLHPELELDESNIIALCNKHCCHLLLGHLGNFRSWNTEVRADAAKMLEKINNRPQGP